MGKKKCYAVRVGRKVGVFENWSECEESIKGFKNAAYKSFTSKEYAEAYLKGEDITHKHKELAKSSNALIAYIDGSFSKEENKYSFGCVLITPEGKIFKECGFNTDEDAVKIKNVAGELLGSMFSVNWAYENNFKKILIRHDYEGIAKWCTGEWKGKNSIVKKYVEYMNTYKNKLEMKFEKVVAHSGDKYNEEADKLAKKALKKGTSISKGENWITVEDINIDNVKIVIELMQEEIDGLTVEEIEENNRIRYVVKELYKEKITVTYYQKSDKVMVQGTPKKLFNMFLAFVTELVDLDQVPKIYDKYSKLLINANDKPEECNESVILDIPIKERVVEQFEEYVPNAYSNLPDKIKRSLQQAIYNTYIDDEMFDQTFLVHPALRALEGFLKIIMNKYRIDYDRNFMMFSKCGNDTYKLLECYHEKVGSPRKIRYINKCYNFYHKNRHELFHWNDPCDIMDDTRMIYSFDSARKMIMDTLKIIDEYYTVN